MIENYFILLIFLAALTAIFVHYNQYIKLRVLLKSHGKPALHILNPWSLSHDMKQAQMLIKELGVTEESNKIKKSLNRVNLSFVAIFVVFFSLGAVFLYIIK